MREDDSRLLDFDPTSEVPPADRSQSRWLSGDRARRNHSRLHRRATGGFCLWPGCDQRSGHSSVPRTPCAIRRRSGVRWLCNALVSVRFHGGNCGLSESDEFSASAAGVHRLAASALCGSIARRKSFFYVRAYSRRFATLYALERLGNGAQVTPVTLPDLLMHFLLNVAPGSASAARRHIDLELGALAPHGGGTNSALNPGVPASQSGSTQAAGKSRPK
jgi:hypothetical protein